MADFNLAIPILLAREGGDKVTDDPEDPGGITKWGISKRAYPNIDIRGLTQPIAVQLYRADYWSKIHGEEINSQAVAQAAFDAAVNHGPGTAIRWMQEIVHVGQDGILGPVSIAAINAFPEAHLLAAFRIARVQNYFDQVRRTPSKGRYFVGWVARALEA